MREEVLHSCHWRPLYTLELEGPWPIIYKFSHWLRALHYWVVCVCSCGPWEYNQGMSQPNGRRFKLSLICTRLGHPMHAYILRGRMNECTLFREAPCCLTLNLADLRDWENPNGWKIYMVSCMVARGNCLMINQILCHAPPKRSRSTQKKQKTMGKLSLALVPNDISLVIINNLRGVSVLKK